MCKHKKNHVSLISISSALHNGDFLFQKVTKVVVVFFALFFSCASLCVVVGWLSRFPLICLDCFWVFTSKSRLWRVQSTLTLRQQEWIQDSSFSLHCSVFSCWYKCFRFCFISLEWKTLMLNFQHHCRSACVQRSSCEASTSHMVLHIHPVIRLSPAETWDGSGRHLHHLHPAEPGHPARSCQRRAVHWEGVRCEYWSNEKQKVSDLFEFLMHSWAS